MWKACIDTTGPRVEVTMAEDNQFVVRKSVRRIICEVLDLPPQKAADSALLADDLNASSMDLVAIALALDDEFGLEIDLAALPQEQVSVGEIIAYVLDRIGNG